MNESLVKYLAGLLDADGSLSFQFKAHHSRAGMFYFGLAIRITSSRNVDQKGYVLSLPKETGMGLCTSNGKDDVFSVWHVTKRAELEMLLPRLIKHMVVKGTHWNWMLQTWRHHRTSNGPMDSETMERLKAECAHSRASNAGPLKPKNHPTWAWLAGFLDGDGHYSNRVSRHGSRTMQIGACAHRNDRVALDFIHAAFGGQIYEHGQCKDVVIWRRSVGSQNASFALRVLPNLAKHSRLKKHKIDAMIHHHRQRLSVQAPKGEAIV